MRHELHFDRGSALVDAPGFGHNRFHPDIPALLTVEPGDEVSMDLRDGFDTQLGEDAVANDLLRLDLERGHAMTGPVAVRGAEPGDLLDVDILSLETSPFGYSAVLPGIGLLGARFSEPFLVKWDLRHGCARSRELPGVTIPARPFLGVLAVAPSHEFLQRAVARERALAREHFVVLPGGERAVPALAAAGLPTLPPRENGGNLDVRHLRPGASVTFTVQVRGALCSAGDPHFAQGDGESAGLAIETSARALLRFTLRKSPRWRPRHPMVRVDGHIVTTGISVDRDGRGRYLDVYLAAQAAADDLLGYLCHERGLTEEQAYVVLGVAVDLQISELVDAPNAVVSAVLPLDIFD